MFVVVGLVDSDAHAGSILKNPFRFQHKNFNSALLTVDGVQYPSIALTPDFSSKQWAMAYQNLFISTNSYYGSDGMSITFDEFAAGYTLLTFDLCRSEWIW